MMNAINTLLTPLYYAVSAILLAWHWLFSHIFGTDSGATWSLSIVGLVLVIRTCLIPLFVKQIRSSRNMQVIQPKVKELQKKYRDDREKFSQELMKLYKETGTNPLSSCLPILIQSPILYSLFRVLNGASAGNESGLHGLMTKQYANSLGNATIFGAHISSKFLGSSGPEVKILAVVLILAMTGAMFFTQLQLMRKNMPKSAQTGQFAQQQKIILYLFPIAFAVGGVSFPIGVLIYWLTTNLWTAGQQYLVIKNNPTPETDAFDAFVKKHGHPPDRNRKARRERELGEAEPAASRAELGVSSAVMDGADDAGGDSGAPNGPVAPSGRVQPKRQTRSKRRT
ncbi:MAG TPA: membrane protein insertase YidC [Actinopolymorphaceae bacterium]|jgi:YidC/Oxa1 family membrane protein insertase